MSARDDFSSAARSPGGWGGQGNMRTVAGGGGHGSLGGAAGTNGSGMGGMGGVGGGAGFGRTQSAKMIGTHIGSSPQTALPRKKPMGLLGPPIPQTFPPAPPVTQEDVPYTGFVPGQPFTGFTDGMAYRDAYEAARNRNWGQYQTRPGTYPGQTGSNTTTIPYNSNGGGYTNIPKNNQGNLPGYPTGNQSTYNKMGADFRNVSMW
jgi:hypothetical protein